MVNLSRSEMSLAVDFLHKVNQEKFAPSAQETNQRLDCIVQKAEEMAKAKREKVELEWDIYTPKMKETLNSYITDVQDVLSKSNQKPIPVEYKKEV